MNIQVKFSPYDTIVIHEIIKYTFEEYVSSLSDRASNLRWVNGVLFDFGTFPKHPEITNDEIKGIIHWSSLNFVILENYQPVITDEKNGRKFQVTNNEANKTVIQVIEWLKQQPFFKE